MKRMLIITQTTFQDCRVHSTRFSDNLSPRNSCIRLFLARDQLCVMIVCSGKVIGRRSFILQNNNGMR